MAQDTLINLHCVFTILLLLLLQGTFSDVRGLFNVSSCQPCPAGMYCDRDGLSNPSGSCDAGHYCILGAIVPNPVSLLTCVYHTYICTVYTRYVCLATLSNFILCCYVHFCNVIIIKYGST